MSKPLVVSIPHRLGRDEAVRRLKEGIDAAGKRYGTFFSIDQQDWNGSDLMFRVSALGQAAAGVVAVGDADVTVSVQLPWLLAKFAEKAQTMLQKQGTLLLEKK